MSWQIITLIVLSIIFLILSSISLFYCFKNNQKMRKIFKPYPIMTIILLLMITRFNEPLLYLALTFGLIGDLFLLSMNKKMFLIGAFSFLIEHIINAHLILNYSDTYHYFIFIVYGILLILLPIISTLILKKYASLPYTLFGGIYGASLIINMVIGFYLAFATTNYLFLLYAFGYLFFIVSDGLIAQKRFLKPFPKIQFVLMLTYYIAQALIYLTFFFYLPF